MTMSPLAREGRHAGGRASGMGEWLALAAAPTFGLMALSAAVDPPPVMLCTSGLLPLDGMATMYLLMSLFHLSPWLKLASGGFPARN